MDKPAVDLVVKVDDVIDFCNAQIPYLLARSDTIALAQLRRVKEFCTDNCFVLGDQLPYGGDFSDD